jgi:hypothetical protein
MIQALDLVANHALGPALKAEGFRKKGCTWRHQADDAVIQVVNVQGSMFGTRYEGRCALNLGIYFLPLADVLGIGRITDAPTEADCHLRRRAAMLRPDHHDTWFDFRAGDAASVEAAASGIRDLYSNFGAPWLRDFSTLRAARDELERTGQTWWAAAASLCGGDLSDAASLLREAIDDAPQHIAPHLDRWGRKHALL